MKFTRIEANFFGLFPRTKWKEILDMSCKPKYIDVDYANKPQEQTVKLEMKSKVLISIIILRSKYLHWTNTQLISLEFFQDQGNKP